MKKLYRLALLSYLGPFVMTFFIALFILLMQFLWKYIDDLVGKGLDWYVIAELMLYASASLVPLALPLAILLSSLMTFGNFGEHYELVACKSSGISLQKMMRPLIVTAVFISGCAFIFSNNILPFANLKMMSLLWDIRQQRPAFSLREGIFYNGIEGYSIKVGNKEEDGQTLRNIMIYDHSLGTGNNKVVMADSGKMEMVNNDTELLITLNNGYSYEEKENKVNRTDTHPLVRSKFREETVRFDMTSFKLTRTDEELFKDNYQMLSVSQLQEAEDTILVQMEQRKKDFSTNLVPFYYFKRDTLRLSIGTATASTQKKDFISRFEKTDRGRIIETALNMARSTGALVDFTKDDFESRYRLVVRHRIEWHRKFTLSFACLVLFFIGAPLGAIIRKGGLGMPVVVSVVFFIIFHILSVTGEKLCKEGGMEPWMGMWLASAVLFPVGAFLTYKATTDSAMLDTEAYIRFLTRLFGKRKLIPQ